MLAQAKKRRHDGPSNEVIRSCTRCGRTLHLQQAKRAGAKVINASRDCEFGERQYTVEDPEGHQWTFSQSIADVEPEKWGSREQNHYAASGFAAATAILLYRDSSQGRTCFGRVLRECVWVEISGIERAIVRVLTTLAA